MSSVTLSQSGAYRLLHQDQDWHGWAVHDNAGHLLGRVTDFIIDTEQARAVALVLDSKTQVPLDHILVGEHSLMVWSNVSTAPADAASWQPFDRGTLDVMESVERPVFRKQLVVIEELVINRETVERDEHIQTTLRRQEVEVTPLPPKPLDPAS